MRWPETFAQVLQLVGERRLGDDGLQPFFTAFTTSQKRSVGPVSLEKAMAPFLSSRMKPVVGTMCETRTARMRRPLISNGCSGVDLDELQHRREVVGQAREVGPGVVVEEVVLHRRDHFGDRVDAQGEAGRAEVVVDEEGQGAGVVEVRVRDQDVLDLDLLLERQGARDPARVEGEGVVDEERGHPVPGDVAAVTAEYLEPHAIVMRVRTLRFAQGRGRRIPSAGSVSLSVAWEQCPRKRKLACGPQRSSVKGSPWPRPLYQYLGLWLQTCAITCILPLTARRGGPYTRRTRERRWSSEQLPQPSARWLTLRSSSRA